MLTFPHAFALRVGDSAPDCYEVRQVHGRSVLEVTGKETQAQIRSVEADALVTRQRGVFIAVRTADCVPVLIEDPVGQVCAAVHAGWRGLLAGVLDAAVQAMAGRPENYRAALGSSIGPCCFEVGEDAAQKFAGFVRAMQRPHVDLQAFARAALSRLGVGTVDPSPIPCTRCDPRHFYSYRRDGKNTPLHRHYVGVP